MSLVRQSYSGIYMCVSVCLCVGMWGEIDEKRLFRCRALARLMSESSQVGCGGTRVYGRVVEMFGRRGW